MLEVGEFCQVTVPHLAFESGEGEFTFAADRNQAGGFELFQMVGKGGGANGAGLAQLNAGAILFTRNNLQNLVATRIRERLGDGSKPMVRE